MREKIVTVEEAEAIANDLRRKGAKLVFTNGCFDLLHVGHVRYLAEARRLGDALLVAINNDESVRALKGDGRPVNRAEDRAAVVAALAAVDHVVVFASVRVTTLLQKLRPAIYVKGGDYTAASLDAEERAALEKMGTQIRILPFEAGYSTSNLLEKMSGTSRA